MMLRKYFAIVAAIVAGGVAVSLSALSQTAHAALSQN